MNLDLIRSLLRPTSAYLNRKSVIWPVVMRDINKDTCPVIGEYCHTTCIRLSQVCFVCVLCVQLLNKSSCPVDFSSRTQIPGLPEIARYAAVVPTVVFHG